MTDATIAPLKFNSKYIPGIVLVERDGKIIGIIRPIRPTGSAQHTHAFYVHDMKECPEVFTGNGYADVKEQVIALLEHDLSPAIRADLVLTRQQLHLMALGRKAPEVQPLKSTPQTPNPQVLTYLSRAVAALPKDVDVQADLKANPCPFPFADALDGYKSLARRNAENREMIKPYLTPEKDLIGKEEPPKEPCVNKHTRLKNVIRKIVVQEDAFGSYILQLCDDKYDKEQRSHPLVINPFMRMLEWQAVYVSKVPETDVDTLAVMGAADIMVETPSNPLCTKTFTYLKDDLNYRIEATWVDEEGCMLRPTALRAFFHAISAAMYDRWLHRWAPYDTRSSYRMQYLKHDENLMTFQLVLADWQLRLAAHGVTEPRSLDEAVK